MRPGIFEENLKTVESIEVSIEHDQCEAFCVWLKKQGYYAEVSYRGDRIDGEWTAQNEDAKKIMRYLWDQYHDSR